MTPPILQHLAEAVRLRIWVVPAVSALLAALLALLLVLASDAFGPPLGIEIDPVSARALLSAVATAMISFTALVFSVTMLVLQLASTQLSPRVMRTFLRDRTNQVVLGLFVATFVYALLVLVSITPERVPQLAVLLTIALVLVAVLAFVAYIDHMAHTIRASSVIEAIADETREAIDRLYPPDGRPSGGPGELSDIARTVICDGRAGYLVLLDEDRLAEVAAEHDVIIEVLWRSGQYVGTGAPLAHVRGGDPGEDIDAVVDGAVRLSAERAMTEDAGFGFRQLVDVALRALSPGTNDQTTANDVIDRLGDLLRQLGGRPMPEHRMVSRDGRLRVIAPALGWDELVASVVGELADSSREVPYVTDHLARTLESLAEAVPEDRAAAVRRARQPLVGA